MVKCCVDCVVVEYWYVVWVNVDYYCCCVDDNVEVVGFDVVFDCFDFVFVECNDVFGFGYDEEFVFGVLCLMRFVFVYEFVVVFYVDFEDFCR